MPAESQHLNEGRPSPGGESAPTRLEPRFEVGIRPESLPEPQMFNLVPWRWTHWVLLLVGPLFIVMYLSLHSWAPANEVITRLAADLGQRGALHNPLLRAETIVSLVSLLLLTPLVGMVALFLLLFGMVIVVTTFGPVVRAVGLPDWSLVLFLAGVSWPLVYARSEVWLPWSLWLLDRLATIYLILFL